VSLFRFLFGHAVDDTIDTRDAHALVANGAVLVDARTPREFRASHAEGAINLPLSELARARDLLGSQSPIVVYCRSGARSARAASMMRDMGFQQVHDLGSIANW